MSSWRDGYLDDSYGSSEMDPASSGIEDVDLMSSRQFSGVVPHEGQNFGESDGMNSAESAAVDMDVLALHLKALVEDALSVNLEKLEKKLLAEFAGLRSDLHGRFSRISAADDDGYHNLKLRQSDASQDSQSPIADIHSFEDIHHPAPKRYRSQQSGDSNLTGVATLRGGSKNHMLSISKEFMDKLMIRHELARMKNKVHAPSSEEWLTWLHNLEKRWNDLEEPERSGCLASLVQARTFEILCVLVIAVNSVFIAIGADWEVKNIGVKVPDLFVFVEAGCSMFFILELATRLTVHRLYFFVNHEMKINCFDFFIVVIGTFDLAVTLAQRTVQDSTEHTENFSLARIARFLKLAKMFRTMRALRFFKDLVVIMDGIRHSLMALFWIFVMLGMLLFIFALVFLQGVIEFLLEKQDSLTDEERLLLERNFGSMWQSMLSLYSAVTGGNDWLVYYEIVTKSGSAYAAMFVGFTFFFLFAMFNILTGLFVEKAAVASKPDIEEVIVSQKKKAVHQANELKSILILLDEHNTGCISWVDFETMMSNPTVVAYMCSVGLEVHEPELFFSMVCDLPAEKALKGAVIPISTFVERCMQMKGMASSIDSQRNLYELHLMKHQLSRVHHTVSTLAKSLKRVLDSQAAERLSSSLTKISRTVSPESPRPRRHSICQSQLESESHSKNRLRL